MKPKPEGTRFGLCNDRNRVEIHMLDEIYKEISSKMCVVVHSQDVAKLNAFRLNQEMSHVTLHKSRDHGKCEGNRFI